MGKPENKDLIKVDWPYEFPGAYWLGEAEEQAVLDVLGNGSLFRYYGLGKPKYVDSLEAYACDYFGSKYALAVNSGTGALMIAMMSMGIGNIANKHRISVLEDCAQCIGGEFKGRKVGNFGQMGIFSLQLNKNVTCGEGGLIVTNDQMLYHRAYSGHDRGLISVDGELVTPEPDAITWGVGRRMPELCGAVASVQIKKLPKILANMRESKKRIKARLEGIVGIGFRRINDDAGDTGSFLIIILDNESKALRAVKKMRGAGLHNVFQVSDYGLHIYHNIPSLVDKIPLSPAGNPWSLAENIESTYEYKKCACPKSDLLFARSILIPIPSKLTKAQEEAAVEVIKTSMED